MLRIWVLAVVVAALALGAGQAGAGELGETPMFCVNAGELGLAGSPPDLMASVFERGRWRPARIYIEPENVTFVLVPLLTGNNTEVSKAFHRGALPPPVLRNETKICVEAAPGVPRTRPPGHGRLVELERRGAKHHVLIARAADVADPTAFDLAMPRTARGEKPDKTRWHEAGEKPPAQPEADVYTISLAQTLNFWASFRLHRATATVGPGGYVEAVFDLPPEARDAAVVLTAGTTPGRYGYAVYKGPVLIAAGSVTVYQGQIQTALAWLGGGGGTYRVRIYNDNSHRSEIYTEVLTNVENRQYFRNDVIRTPRLIVLLALPRYAINTHLIRNSYLAVPGFIVDAASSITLRIYVKAPPEAVQLGDRLLVYWGGLYLGELRGYRVDAYTMEFNGVVTVPPSLLIYLLPTKGLGGVISVGPLTISSPTVFTIEVTAAVRRPQELAAAGNDVYAKYVRRASETFLFLDRRTYMAKLEIFSVVREQGSERYLELSTMPFSDMLGSFYTKVRFYVRFYDSSLRPVNIVVAAVGHEGVQTVSWWGQVLKNISWWWGEVLKNIPFLSAALGLYDLVKSTYDALRRSIQSFPVVGYVTFLLDSFVQAASADVKISVLNGHILVIELYTGWYNDPLTTRIITSLDTPPAYFAVTGVEYFVDGVWRAVYRVDVPAWPFTTVGVVGHSAPSGGFAFRTLLCGAQETLNSPSVRCDPAYFR